MSKKKTISIHLESDWKFLAILPAVNLNRHSKSLEIEWLFFGAYIDFREPKQYPPHGMW